MQAMAPSDWLRKFHHPQRGPVSLDHLAASYGWHGEHHVANCLTEDWFLAEDKKA
jgi:hypothetical protein